MGGRMGGEGGWEGRRREGGMDIQNCLEGRKKGREGRKKGGCTDGQ